MQLFLYAYNLEHIENQLKNRWKYSYQWGRKQNDLWDGYTKFIYRTQNWEELIVQIKETVEKHQLDKRQLFNYAANRWYNFWSAMAVEQIFKEMEQVLPALNSKNRLVDFQLNGINFDHKTSVFPKNFGKNIDYAQKYKRELIEWLYENQSQEQRKHLKNRLFIIVHQSDGNHWKLKARISEIREYIEEYVRSFNKEQLLEFNFENGNKTFSDLIWILK